MGHVQRCNQTAWDNSLGKLFGEEGGIAKALEGMKNIWNTVWTGIKDTVKGLLAPIQGPIDALKGAIDAVKNALSNLGNISVPSISLPKLPKISIPGFAAGVKDFAGGLAVVGEKGPELVNLPRGSDVTPMGQGRWRWRVAAATRTTSTSRTTLGRRTTCGG